MRAVFIRHGQSTGNAGIPANDLSLLELTELGRQQAREVASSWTERPTLIVTSPYLRTAQTAAPTIARFPDAPVETWPIQEFTYLDTERWNGTLSSVRKPFIEAYWKRADPKHVDGPGAESFSTLLCRAEATLDRLNASPDDSIVYVFSHGQFIQAVNMILQFPNHTDEMLMIIFWRYNAEHPIGNCDRLEILCRPGAAVRHSCSPGTYTFA